MKERPILFSGPMVKAILEGRKTMTRRVVKHSLLMSANKFDKYNGSGTIEDGSFVWHDNPKSGSRICVKCPYGDVGDRLWVKETFNYIPLNMRGTHHRIEYKDGATKDLMGYEAYGAQPAGMDGLIHMGIGSEFTEFDKGNYGAWKSPLFMPRCASRILLEIVNVKVERLQEISDEDIDAEGLWPDGSWVIPIVETAFSTAETVRIAGGSLKYGDPERYGFIYYWDSINAKRGYSWESNPWVWVIEFEVAQ